MAFTPLSRQLEQLIERATGRDSLAQNLATVQKGLATRSQTLDEIMTELKRAPSKQAPHGAALQGTAAELCNSVCTTCLNHAGDAVCGEWSESTPEAEVRRNLCAKPVWRELGIAPERCMSDPNMTLSVLNCSRICE